MRDVFEDAYNYMKSGQLMRQVVNKINDIDFNNLTARQHFGDIYEQILNDLQSAGNAGEYYTPRAVTTFMARMVDPKPGQILLDPACGTGGFLTCAMQHMRERYVKRPEDETSMQVSLRAVEKKPLPHMLAVTNMLLHGIEDPAFLRHDNTLARPYISWGRDERVDIVLTNPPFGGKEEDGIESNFPQHFRTRETADLFLALIIRLLKPGGKAAVVLPDGSLFGEGVKTRLKEHLMKECNLHTIVRLPNSVFRPYASIGTNLLFFEKGEPTPHTVEEDLGDPEALLEELTSAEADVVAARDELRRILTEALSADRLLDLYDRVADAPDAVGRLRRFVVDLAVRGKLVEQDPVDEPASELMRRIAAEKAQLMKAGRLTRRKGPSRLGEPPFALPANWLWSHIGEVVSDRGQQVPDRPFTYIDVSAIDKKAGLVANPRVLEPGKAPSRARKVARSGDVVYSCVRPYLLNVAIIEGDFDPPSIASTAFEVLNGHGLVLPRYTWMVLRSSFMIACVEQRQRGQAYPAIKSTDFAALPFPLPPLPEQRRIVTKVDELMVLCDRLEAGLVAAEATRSRLLDSLLDESLASQEGGRSGDVRGIARAEV